MLWLVLKNLVPSGILDISFRAVAPPQLVKNFASNEPWHLFGVTKDNSRKERFRITTQPSLPFDVTVPRGFVSARVGIWFQSPDGQKVQDVAIRQADGSYKSEPLSIVDPVLGRLSQDWDIIRKGDLVLWQKKSLDASHRFFSVDSFLKNPPDPHVTMQYKYTLPPLQKIVRYRPKVKPIAVEKSLRGSHTLVTYVGAGEQLSFTFFLEDINRHFGKDRVRVELWNVNEKVGEYSTRALGSRIPTGEPSSSQTLVIERSGLPEGVYTLRITASDDVFIKRIVTMQNKLMFEKRLYLADNNEYKSILGTKRIFPTTVTTSSTHLSVLTAHEKGLQTLIVHQKHFRLQQPHVPVEITTVRKRTVMTTRINDIQITGDGYFAVAPGKLFTLQSVPYPDLTARSNLQRYDYVLALSSEVPSYNGWMYAQAVLRDHTLSNDNGIMHFQFTSPTLDQGRRTMYVRSINLTLEKPPWSLRDFVQQIRKLVSNESHALEELRHDGDGSSGRNN